MGKISFYEGKTKAFSLTGVYIPKGKSTGEVRRGGIHLADTGESGRVLIVTQKEVRNVEFYTSILAQYLLRCIIPNGMFLLIHPR